MGGAHYKLMAISDTHLGEDCSLLSFPQARWHLWKTLRQKLGRGKKFSVDELVLVGDIPDRCLSSTSQIISHTNDFTEMLGDVATFRKAVYLIGNHDHSIWTNYRARRFGAAKQYGVSPPKGFRVIQTGNLVAQKYESEILNLLFGYDKGSSWRAILKRKSEFHFAVAYPLYLKILDKRAYVFSHGVHFCPVTKWLKYLYDFRGDCLKKIRDTFNHASITKKQLNKTLLNLELDLGPTMDAVWPSSCNDPTPLDTVYYLMCKITGKFETKRSSPLSSKMISWSELPNISTNRIRRLTAPINRPTNPVTENFINEFWPIARKYIRGIVKNMPVTFIHGHTHHGGWGEFFENGSTETRIYDLGGWVVHNRHHHPACHIFIVDERGEEFLLDISFKSVKIDGDFLLDIARKDAENRF
jgi:hypothetical protein